MPSKQPEYTWDAEAQRYRDKRGHLVPKAWVLAWILRAVGRSKKAFEKVAQEYLDGKITELQFQAIMQQGIASGHRAMAAIAAGGAALLIGNLAEQARNIIATQRAYMVRFAAQIATHQLSDAQVLARAAMYADALYGTFANIQTAREATLGGQRYARRIIDPAADHCDECPDLADLGWVPIEEMVPIGDTTCLTNCRCEIEYSDGTDIEQPPAPEGTQVYISVE